MNKLVYLYELDSVRNSEEEIKIAQQALYEEIVVNGNQVVLTFNQLTDSKGFLCSLNDEDSYNEILKLFKMGVLRVSRVKDARTASQFVQNVIDRCIANDNNSFIFSGLPVLSTEKELLSMIKNAIMYSDPAILEEYLVFLEEKNNIENNTKNKKRNENEINRIKYLIRFVNLILELSIEATANNPLNNNYNETMLDFLDKVSFLYPQYKFKFLGKKSKEMRESLFDALELLYKIKADFINLEGEKEANRLMKRRSNWVNKLNTLPNEKKVCMAEAIIDLCYNYSMEESILGVSKHYLENRDEMFIDDFEHRIVSYWNLYIENIHKFHKGESKNVDKYDIEIPEWNVATRLVSNRINSINKKSMLYEEGYEKDVKEWRSELYKSILKRLGVASIYILVFCVVQYIIGVLEERFLSTIMNIWASQIIASILDIVCFGILSTLISNWFDLPDILDNISKIGEGIHDFFKYKLVKRGIAYNLIIIKRKMKGLFK